MSAHLTFLFGFLQMPYGVTAVSLFLLGMFNYLTDVTGYIFGAIALIAINLAFSVTWIATPELFELPVRSTTHTFSSASARIGAFFCGYWIASYETTLEKCMLMSFAALTATACAFMLPETTRKELP